MSDQEDRVLAVPFSLDGERLEGRADDTLAAAMLRAGVTTFTRSIKYHRPRGPFCLGGSCGQCLVRVDGVPSLPACRVELKQGMSCERQNAPLGLVDRDLFRAVDFLFPGGLDHHHLMIQSRLLGQISLEVARRLAGLGTLPSRDLLAQQGSARAVPLVIVGAGPAGLSAALGAVESDSGGLRPLLLERDSKPGGTARLFRDAERAIGRSSAAPLERLGDRVELLCDAEVVGLYSDPQPEGDALLAVRQEARLLAVRAHRVVIAMGGVSQPHPFPGNDRPGVYAARGLLALHDQTGVRVGEGAAIALVGVGDELERCRAALLSRGYSLAACVSLDEDEIVRVRGRPVAEIQIRARPRQEPSSAIRKIRCGAVAVALPVAAQHDLASSVGARATFSASLGGFPLEVDAEARTSVAWIFAVGTAVGRSLLDSGVSGNEATAFAQKAGQAAAVEAKQAAALAR